jgi:hypothetical protein
MLTVWRRAGLYDRSLALGDGRQELGQEVCIPVTGLLWHAGI